MLQKLFTRENERWSLPLLWVLLSVLGFVFYGAYLVKPAGVLAGAVLAYLLATRELRALRVPYVWPLLGYVVFAALTAAWAMSGKFFLREYLKIFLGAAICVALLLKERFDADTVRRALSLIAGTAGVYAFLSVENAAFGLTSTLLRALIPNAASVTTGWYASRLYGVYGNPNLESTVFAMGVLFSVALLCVESEKYTRIAYAAVLSFCSFMLLMGLSLGALICFAVAVMLCLIFAGERRGAVLARMLEAAVPTVFAAVGAYLCFTREATKPVLLIALFNAAVIVLLELTVTPRLLAVLDVHRKLTGFTQIGVVAFVTLCAVLSVSVHAPYTSSGGSLYRSIRLDVGDHTVTLQADGRVHTRIYARSQDQILTYTRDLLYIGEDTQISFTLPSRSDGYYIRFDADPGVTITSAVLDGKTEIPLCYPLLPDFVVNRFHDYNSAQSSMSRFEIMRDGLKLWRMSPVIGLGLGAFETGYTRVQETPYTTRFAHNHYIQTLLETGVIGCAFYVLALGAMFLALWKHRRDADSPYRPYYAVLFAAMTMLTLQPIWDASLSFVIVIFYAYTIFGVTLRAFAVEGAVTAETTVQPQKKKRRGMVVRREITPLRVAATLFPIVFTLTLCANIYAQHRLQDAFHARSYNEFFSTMDLAAKIDAYEYNDAKLSYVRSAADNRSEVSQDVLDRADKYAAELTKVQSNTIPQMLVAYYLTMEEYENAVDAAKHAAVCSAANADVWNETAGLLRQGFSANYYAPLLKNAAPLVRALLDYRAMLDAHNETALNPITLNEENEDFFTRIARLDPYPEGDPAQAFELLSA